MQKEDKVIATPSTPGTTIIQGIETGFTRLDRDSISAENLVLSCSPPGQVNDRLDRYRASDPRIRGISVDGPDGLGRVVFLVEDHRMIYLGEANEIVGQTTIQDFVAGLEELRIAPSGELIRRQDDTTQ